MRMIFHMPMALDPGRLSGSHIRPFKMLEAFKALGYQVDLVMGDQKTRKEQMKRIKEKISAGTSYDFCYGESSTMPAELTEPHHLPTNWGMDFRFFKFLKSRGIPLGVFYRDIHWAFDNYKNSVPLLKRAVATFFYKRELKKLQELIDVLYLPSQQMAQVLPYTFKRIETLPPAIDQIQPSPYKDGSTIKIFYVGGISGIYNMEVLFQVVGELDFLELVVVTRKNEWTLVEDRLGQYLNPRVKIMHGGPSDYEEELREADLCSLFIKPTPYWNFAVPVKLYEYLKFEKPLLGSPLPAISPVIKQCGFCVDYDDQALIKLLMSLRENRNLIKEKKMQAIAFAKGNLWKNRAMKVEDQLRSVRQ